LSPLLVRLSMSNKENEMVSEAMVLGYSLLEKITQMEDTIKEQKEEIDVLLNAIKEYERGE
jgi:hypothetical protein